MLETSREQKTFGFNLTTLARVLPMIAQVNRYAIFWLLPFSLFILWWLAAHYAWMPVQILPSPAMVWQTFLQMAEQELWWQLGISLQRLLVGGALGVVCGLLLGIVLGYSRTVELYLASTFYALVIIPTLAWLPLLMAWLGIENALKIFIIFKATLLPIAIHTQAGVRDIQPKLREMAAVLQLSATAVLLKLILPAALPYFFTGLRLAIAAGWTTLIAVELLASSEGIGYLMVTGRQLFQLDMVFVTIIVIALVGICLDRLVQVFERRLVFWPHAALAAHTIKQNNHLSKWTPWLLPALLFCFWFLATHFAWVSTIILPSPSAVGQALLEGIGDGSLVTAMSHSLYRALVGLVLGGSIGLLTGILLGLCKPLQDIVAPTLNTLRLIAIFAWIPLLTAWFGLSDLSKIVFIALATFFPMFIATWKGCLNVPQHLDEAANSLRLTSLQRLRLLVLPSIAPSVFAGFRLALMYSWMASFGAEYLMGTGIGIGSYMMAAQQQFEMDRVLAATALVAVLGIGLAWFGQITESYATAWRKNEG